MKRGKILAFVGIAVLSLSACGRREKIEIPSKPQETAVPTEESTEETKPPMTEESREGMVRSYLTGQWVEEAVGRGRPVAVMMSNEKAACPQSGIAEADVVFEVPVEGGTNRFMGIYENYKELKKIGSVRSARTYYVLFAKEFEAVLAHYGQAKFAIPYLENKNTNNLNGLEAVGNVVYYRTKDRKAPHNAFASGEGILKGIEQKGYSMEYPSGYQGHFQFMKEENGMNLVTGLDASKVVLGYVISKPWFEYNPEDGLYYRYQYGEVHKDGDSGEQVRCKNIIIQYFNNSYYEGSEYLNIYLQGEGIGKYITNGKAIDIKWKKDSEWGITKYYDAAGVEIHLNPGKTWISLIPSNRLENLQLTGG